jgi:phosphonate transport system permease protein
MITTVSDSTSPRRWKRPRLIPDPKLRLGLMIALLTYLTSAFGSVDVDWARVSEGLARVERLFAGFLQPDFTSRWSDIEQGLIESLTMTVCATVFGIVLALPIGLGAARNIAPLWLYGICRAVIAFARAFQEIIVAILLVAMFGFGTFAGFLTLSLSTIGFLSKLIADDIEEIDEALVEAVRSTGGGFWQIIDYAVASQVMPRFVGLAVYKIDINFRESSVIGIVGAGGIGATLNTALDRYEFETAGAILIIIIGIVMLCEYASGWIRKGMA